MIISLKRAIQFVVVSLILTLTSPAATAQAKTILFVGDSIGAGYGIASGSGWLDLSARYIAKNYSGKDSGNHSGNHSQWRLVNASISGDTSTDGLNRLPTLLRSHQPAITIIELGGNDALRGVNLVHVRNNLLKMISLSKAAGSQVMLVKISVPPNFGNRFKLKFEAMYDQLGQSQRIPVIDLLKIAPPAQRASYLQADRVHPNLEAQPLMAKILLTALLPLLNK